MIHSADLPPALLVTAAGVLGLVVGSFLNVVVRRLPKMLRYRWVCESVETLAEARQEVGRQSNYEGGDSPPPSLWTPPSHCLACGKNLKAWHKIPVLSFFLLRGRCGFCRLPISKQYPTVELLTLLVSVVVAARFGLSLETLAALVFSWILIALAFIDYNEQLLPDELTLSLLWTGLAANAFGLFTDAASAVWGAAAGYASLWLIYHAVRLATGRHGLGHGDMKLLAAIGAWCGWEILPFVLLAASLIGLAAALVLITTRRMRKDETMPFGPYLAAAGWMFFVYTFILENRWTFAPDW